MGAEAFVAEDLFEDESVGEGPIAVGGERGRWVATYHPKGIFIPGTGCDISGFNR
jgi:hypothetical protein